MPHKHKRRERDANAFDLPPSVIAKPLPVRNEQKNGKNGDKSQSQSQNQNQDKTKQKNKRSKPNTLADDTPKAFQRLMQFQTRGKRPSTEDTQTQPGRKRKRDEDGSTTKKAKKSDQKQTATPTETVGTAQPAAPKILPGEKLSDFAARVDRAMPLSSMKKSTTPRGGSGSGSDGLPKIREERRTKHEKHLRRLQKHWREEEAEIREREAAEREEREAEMEEELGLWKQWEAEAGSGKKRKHNKNNNNSADADPWAQLKSRDRKEKKAALPFDVVQAPPQLTKPREVFKVRGGARVDVANVPVAAGSLRRREELAGERRTVVEQYRRLMAEKRQ
ncbi:hypothetical protein ASPZODRAFT_57531 [Penicilliopsis zonata CBS 506.65]|uniref:Urease accessory protein UreD n=1 Tax=Penicilliopsis zonata CBS 506.65 TaxID=1073090 RepID=A0A1L9SVQ5_9EURO|nr:hypothetical protein ASPZODRAFT_57531 [Penicilliopsis zonata CBS 506.65]OJJ51191.1 hypothetical protein ASPZODRAFT_57531 [Penicilliopsis zonata CBS 506.65]